jgi:hypothetical protein
MGARWCTVTVTDAEGRRHSMDLKAESSYDAAHLYVTTAKSQETAMMPSRARAVLSGFVLLTLDTINSLSRPK